MRLLQTALRPLAEAADEASQRAAHRREQRLRIAMRSAWPKLRRMDLDFGRFSIRHVPTGTEYRVHRGEVDAVYSPIAAYYIDADGAARNRCFALGATCGWSSPPLGSKGSA